MEIGVIVKNILHSGPVNCGFYGQDECGTILVAERYAKRHYPAVLSLVLPHRRQSLEKSEDRSTPPCRNGLFSDMAASRQQRNERHFLRRLRCLRPI